MNRKYCILLMHSYYGKVWWCQFGLTAIKKKQQTNTLNDKETFLSAKSWIFTIAILWGQILQNWEKRQKISYLSWIAVLFLNSFSHDISHIQILNWSMPSSKKHVYLEKNKWLNFIIFFLNSVIFLRRPKIICVVHCIFLPNNLANLKQE